jgi:hypothetical protein
MACSTTDSSISPSLCRQRASHSPDESEVNQRRVLDYNSLLPLSAREEVTRSSERISTDGIIFFPAARVVSSLCLTIQRMPQRAPSLPPRGLPGARQPPIGPSLVLLSPSAVVDDLFSRRPGMTFLDQHRRIPGVSVSAVSRTSGTSPQLAIGAFPVAFYMYLNSSVCIVQSCESAHATYPPFHQDAFCHDPQIWA